MSFSSFWEGRRFQNELKRLPKQSAQIAREETLSAMALESWRDLRFCRRGAKRQRARRMDLAMPPE